MKRIRRLFNDQSLSQKAGLNSIALLLDYMARIAVNLITARLLADGLGKVSYGIWQLLSQVTTYLNAAGGRPTQALVMLTANQQHTTDDDTKRRAVGSAVAVWLLFLPVLILLGGLLVWQLPYWIADAPVSGYRTIRIATGILVLNLIILNLADVPRAVLSGENQGYRRIGLSALMVILGGIAMIFSLKMGWGLIGIAASVLLTMLLTNILFFQVTKSYIAWFGLARPGRAEIMRLLRLSGWFMLWQFMWQFISFGDVVLLGFWMEEGAAAAAEYTTSRYAPQVVGGVIIALFGGMFPGLGGIIGEKNYARAAAIRTELFTLTWAAVTICGVVVLVCNRSFVTLWLDETYYIGTLPFLILVSLLTLTVFVRHDSVIIDYTLNVRNKMLISGFAVIVTVVAAAFLFNRAASPLIGLEMGFVIGQIVLLIAYPWLISRALHIPYLQQYVGAIRPTICTALLFAAASFISTQFQVTSWIQLVLLAGLTLIAATLVSVPLGLSAAPRQILFKRFRTLTDKLSR